MEVAGSAARDKLKDTIGNAFASDAFQEMDESSGDVSRQISPSAKTS